MTKSNAAEKFIPPQVEERVILTQEQYQYFSNFMFEKTGVNLEKNKIPMIQARLAKRLMRLGINDFDAYIEIVQTNQLEMVECINSLTTHKTDFFREPAHFDLLKNQIFAEISKKTAKLRIWSAACSTGEEVYTLAMVAKEYFAERDDIDVKILGTDIDTEVLQRASNGIYSKEVIKPVDFCYLQRYFQRGSGANTGFYRIRPELSQMVKFRRHNLLESFAAVSNMQFNIIFLRNVLIYFTEKTRQEAIEKIYEVLANGGYLFIGHSESLAGINHQLQSVAAAVYKKV